jgi:hypothetical protein
MEVWSPTDVSAQRLDCMPLCGILERADPHTVYMPRAEVFFGHVANYFMRADFLGICWSNIEEQGHQANYGFLGCGCIFSHLLEMLLGNFNL